MMIFTLACWLFMRSGYGLVLSKLADAHAVSGPGWGKWEIPTTGPISRAKARLGAEPLKLLFHKVSGPAGTPDTPGVFYRDLRVLSVDGFTLDLADTAENEEFFGRGTNGSDTPNPYPQLRALALAESGTRSLLGAAYGPYRTGEQTLMDDLLPALGPGMVLLADRNFASYALWRKVTATGVALCWRTSRTSTTTAGRPRPGSVTSRLPNAAAPRWSCVPRPPPWSPRSSGPWSASTDLIGHAATPGLDPSRISFKRAIEAARDSATRAALSPRANSTAR
jgi:hypothetical protein